MKIQRKATKCFSILLALLLTLALVPALQTYAAGDSQTLLNWGFSDLKYLTLTIDTEPISREYWDGGDPNFYNETVIINSGTTLTISVNPELMMLSAADDDDLLEGLEIRFRPEGGDFTTVTDLLIYGNYNYFRGREDRPLHSLMLLGVESWDENAESLSVSFVLDTSGVLTIKNSNFFYDGAPWFNFILAGETVEIPTTNCTTVSETAVITNNNGTVNISIQNIVRESTIQIDNSNYWENGSTETTLYWLPSSGTMLSFTSTDSNPNLGFNMIYLILEDGKYRADLIGSWDWIVNDDGSIGNWVDVNLMAYLENREQRIMAFAAPSWEWVVCFGFSDEEPPTQQPAAPTAQNAQANSITVLYNDEIINFTQPPTERNGFLFYPLEDVLDAFSGGHGWNPDTFTVFGEKNGNIVEIPLRDLSYWVNGSMLDVANELMPFVENERTYVYLDLIVEGFGLSVDWNGEARTISIR